MGNLLFSPSGRIGSSDFMRGVTLLVIVGLVLGLLAVLVPALMAVQLIGLVLIWCWVVLWVKRYHDGGKSGWMTFIPVIVWFVVLMVFGFVMKAVFADPDKTAAIEAATAAGDFMTVLSLGNGLTMVGELVNAFGGAAISYVVAMLFNNMIKGDADDNQFGPAT